MKNALLFSLVSVTAFAQATVAHPPPGGAPPPRQGQAAQPAQPAQPARPAQVVGAPPAAHTAAPVVSGVRVRVAPPPPRAEIRPAAPSPNHVWVDGHWAWRNNQQVWVSGVWVQPPGAGYAWVPARWENVGGEFVFYEGHWNYAQPVVQETYYEPPPPEPQPVEIEEAPPEPVYEVRPEMPFVGAVWIPGYWRWHGHHHRWVGGHWSAPREGYRWAEGRWIEHGHRYRWEPGHWVR